MLRPLALVEDFNQVERQLTDADDARCDRAASLIGPANPGRRGKTIRFSVARRGGGLTPDAIRRLLRRLDSERITGQLEVVGTAGAATPEEQPQRHAPLRGQW